MARWDSISSLFLRSSGLLELPLIWDFLITLIWTCTFSFSSNNSDAIRIHESENACLHIYYVLRIAYIYAWQIQLGSEDNSESISVIYSMPWLLNWPVMSHNHDVITLSKRLDINIIGTWMKWQFWSSFTSFEFILIYSDFFSPSELSELPFSADI